MTDYSRIQVEFCRGTEREIVLEPERRFDNWSLAKIRSVYGAILDVYNIYIARHKYLNYPGVEDTIVLLMEDHESAFDTYIHILNVTIDRKREQYNTIVSILIRLNNAAADIIIISAGIHT